MFQIRKQYGSSIENSQGNKQHSDIPIDYEHNTPPPNRCSCLTQSQLNKRQQSVLRAPVAPCGAASRQTKWESITSPIWILSSLTSSLCLSVTSRQDIDPDSFMRSRRTKRDTLKYTPPTHIHTHPQRVPWNTYSIWVVTAVNILKLRLLLVQIGKGLG